MITLKEKALLLAQGFLNGFLDPVIECEDVEYLLYLLQETEGPLGLRFNKTTSSGPFLKNIPSFLLEDKFTIDKEELEEANAKLSKDESLQEKINQVLFIIEGFESSFGLRLLTSLHWEIIHGRADYPSYSNDFSKRQVDLTLLLLKERIVDFDYSPQKNKRK